VIVPGQPEQSFSFLKKNNCDTTWSDSWLRRGSLVQVGWGF